MIITRAWAASCEGAQPALTPMAANPYDFRETIIASMRDGVRLRIYYAPPHDPASEHVILPRDWTVGSTFFAWDFRTSAYRTFDAYFIVECIAIGADTVFPDARLPQRRPRPAPPGREGEALPPIEQATPPPMDPGVRAARVRIALALALAACLAGLCNVLGGVDGVAVRILGTVTPTPSITPAPTRAPTATSDPRMLRGATATAEAIAVLATRAAPCFPANGICVDVDGRTLVLAIPPDALVLAYPQQAIEAAAARTVMRHHIRAVLARDALGKWLLMRFTDGAEMWVQAAAVGAVRVLEVVPMLQATPTPTKAAVRRRVLTPTP